MTTLDNAVLKQFMQRIGAIEPQYIDIFGNGSAGMPGRLAASASSANAGVDIAVQIRQAAVAFARAYESRKRGGPEVEPESRKLEELLFVAVTLGVVSQKEADEDIDMLHNLANSRSDGL